MSTTAEQNPQEQENLQPEQTEATETTAAEQTEQQNPEAGTAATEGGTSEADELRDKYLRLHAEFDNFRRRTSKERLELFKTANQDLMVALIPVLDDLERAQAAMQDAQDVTAVREGVELIFGKFLGVLQQKGLKPMEAIGQPFDADVHEAITQIPAPNEEMKGKVIDQVEKGYYLNDKVVRFAKVVIGA
ncbi:nucleotide exchange factor GrpE [Rufibacter glacialis]|uniref:Protein GrpE n=1 Tax=Rufibacter glacialis TaxID=1259555 RepID=A0A5M8QNB0_9BACT|nr:nucleotide exchange factor GrpE [Rufibacter glacialis]KAA6437625.1 nucleotide exchange factor GrpE [Rufibacter glacialis]GGK57718.1 protein GrpE [Rufibacter glacialis]